MDPPISMDFGTSSADIHLDGPGSIHGSPYINMVNLRLKHMGTVTVLWVHTYHEVQLQCAALVASSSPEVQVMTSYYVNDPFPCFGQCSTPLQRIFTG